MRVMSQGMGRLPHINIDTYDLKAVHGFTYQNTIIIDNLSPDAELIRHIGKTSTTLTSLINRVWSNNNVTMHTKL